MIPFNPAPQPCVLSAPLKGFPLELGIGAGSEETRMMGLPDGRKCVKIDLAVLIQYRRVTDRHPASHPPTQPARHVIIPRLLRRAG